MMHLDVNYMLAALDQWGEHGVEWTHVTRDGKIWPKCTLPSLHLLSMFEEVGTTFDTVFPCNNSSAYAQ
jgi:hypothetical protein